MPTQQEFHKVSHWSTTLLPIVDNRGGRIFVDFVGPLAEDRGFDNLCTITDQLSSDFRLIPCRTEITGENFAQLFFNHKLVL